MTFKIKNISGLPEVAKAILNNLTHKIVLFEGDLGAGKTTLIKAMLKEMGSADEVSSPTFSIVNEYETPNGKLYHFDFYRIKSEEEALDFGTDEYIDSGNYCFIEWPDRIENILPEKYHRIKIMADPDARNIFFD